MEITYYGANCLKIATKQLTLLIDPITGEYGPNPKLKTDVVIYSQQPSVEVTTKAEIVIDGPGEYEVKGVTIDGIASRLHIEEDAEKMNGVSYLVSHKEHRVLVAGNIHPELSEELTDRVDGIDVLVVPVGGGGLTLDKEAASDLVRRFDPNFVLPIHYDDGTTYPVPQADISLFLQEVGATDAPRENSFKLTGRDSSDETSFVVLEPQK